MTALVRHPSTKPLPLSRAVQAGGFLFLSGVLPAHPDGQPLRGTIEEETRAVLRQIDEVLTGLGARRQDVVRATIWLADLADFAGFNAAYAEYFGDTLPARSTVQATLNRGAKVEIEVQAWRG